MLKLTALRRTLALLVAAGLGAVSGIAVVWPDSSGAATSTVYSATVAGTDLHALNPHVVPQFVAGGGVQAISDGPLPEWPWYLEATIDLPVGAKVTSLTVSFRSCSSGDSIVFGSYSPTTLNTVQSRTIAHFNPNDTCLARKTYAASGNPITTVATGRRYAIDWLVDSQHAWTSVPASSTYSAFYGATVKYTCTAPCVP
jgi:hypothetical protein